MAFNGDFGTSSDDLAPNFDFYTAGLQQSGVLPGSWQMRQAYHGGSRSLGSNPSQPGFQTVNARDVNTRLGVGQTNWNSNSPTTNKVQDPGQSYMSRRTKSGSQEEQTIDRFFGGLGKMSKKKNSNKSQKQPSSRVPGQPLQGGGQGGGGGGGGNRPNVNAISSGNSQSFGDNVAQSGNIAGGSQFIASDVSGNMGNIGNINYGGSQTNLGAYARQTNMSFGFDPNHRAWNPAGGNTPPPSGSPAQGGGPKPVTPGSGGAAAAIGRGPAPVKALAAGPASKRPIIATQGTPATTPTPTTTSGASPAATSGTSPAATYTMGGSNPTSVNPPALAPAQSTAPSLSGPTSPAVGQGFVPFGELGPGAPAQVGSPQPAAMGPGPQPLALGPASSTPQYGGRGPAYGGVRGPNRMASPTGAPAPFSPYSAASANGYNAVPQTNWYQSYQQNTMAQGPSLVGAGAPAASAPTYASPFTAGANGYGSVPQTSWYQNYAGGQPGMPSRHDFLPGGGRLRSDYTFGGAPAQGPTHPTAPASNRTEEQQADFELKRQAFNRRSRRPGT